MQYRRNVNHEKKYSERVYDVLPPTSKSTDASEGQRATQSLSNQESIKPVNVSSERQVTTAHWSTHDQMMLLWSKKILSPYVQQESKDYHLNFNTMD